MTVVVSTMLLNSLISNGEKTIGGSLTTAEQPYYLGKLNAMVESWSLDRRMCYSVKQENFSLTASTGTYTIGVGGTFNTARPTKILNAFIRDSANADSGVDIVSYDAFDGIVVKGVAGSYPRWLYYDQGYDSSGLATIKLYPQPQANLTLYIDSATQLQSFASVTTALLMPPGYQRAIESNFAIETSPGLKSVPPELAKIARDSLAALKGVNLPDAVSRLDAGIVRAHAGNIISGP
jgi:hypothetical protein